MKTQFYPQKGFKKKGSSPPTFILLDKVSLRATPPYPLYRKKYEEHKYVSYWSNFKILKFKVFKAYMGSLIYTV